MRPQLFPRQRRTAPEGSPGPDERGLAAAERRVAMAAVAGEEEAGLMADLDEDLGDLERRVLAVAELRGTSGGA